MITPHGDNPQPASDRRIGQRFGDYVVEGQIGRGGMGVVFRARHETSGEVVALKLMAPDLADNESFRERFVREAEAGPNLAHPSIVPVFESGEADGELFIAMQLIEGTDLKGLIEQEGRLDPKRVLSIFRQAASALDAAHESGMVHRDVKPQNILVIPRETPEGVDRVYLTDFGLVRPVASENTASRTGQVFGSVPYMAPELIEGIPADGRADVYALGCVLFECLTGSVPFERDNEVSSVWAHIHEDPPLLTDKVPDLPGGLNDVVIKAMSKHPDDRFLTCGEFITELELGLGRKLSNLKYSHIRPLVARIPRRKTEREVWAPNYFPELSRVRSATRERLDWRKVAVFAVAVVFLSSVQFGREGGLPQAVVDAAEAAGSAGESLLDSTFGSDEDAAGQEEGELLGSSGPLTGAGPATEGNDKGGLALLPEAPGQGADEFTDGNEGASQPAGGGVGSNEPLIAYTSTSADGGSFGDIYVMAPDGTGRRNLTNSELPDEDPDWSPDGSKILFVTAVQVWTGRILRDLYVMNADGTGLARVTTTKDDEKEPTWSPDGTKIAFTRGGWVTVMNADGSGSPEQLVQGYAPDWSPDGRWIAYSTDSSANSGGNATRGRIRLYELSTGRSTKLSHANPGNPYLTPQHDHVEPDWSPDGRQIAFIKGFYLSVLDPFTDTVDRAAPQRVLTSYPQHPPSWTPDGRYISYTFKRDLYVIKPDGTGKTLLIESDSDEFREAVWRPVGGA